VTPAEYLDSVKERLLTDAIVTGFDIRRERHTVSAGHLRVRLSLVDGSRLEFSEYLERTPEERMQVAVYSTPYFLFLLPNLLSTYSCFNSHASCPRPVTDSCHGRSLSSMPPICRLPSSS
jgi:hypothetical protein